MPEQVDIAMPRISPIDCVMTDGLRPGCSFTGVRTVVGNVVDAAT